VAEVANRIPLPRISPRLAAQFEPNVPYQRIYKATLNGELPLIQQGDNGRYFALESDLPGIAAALGLRPRAAIKA
jgi:hypothetical protein